MTVCSGRVKGSVDGGKKVENSAKRGRRPSRDWVL